MLNIEELKKALEAEDYKTSAELRDKLNKLK
jgi:protein-arginine kinase activator protein McsA